MKEPTAQQISKAKQWMIKERIVRAIIAHHVAKAEVELAEMCVTDRQIGGVIDPQPEGLFSGSVNWNQRKEADAESASELEKWFPDWNEAQNLQFRRNAESQFQDDTAET